MENLAEFVEKSVMDYKQGLYLKKYNTSVLAGLAIVALTGYCIQQMCTVREFTWVTQAVSPNVNECQETKAPLYRLEVTWGSHLTKW